MPNYNLGASGIYTIKAGVSDTIIFCQDQSNGVILGSPQEDNVAYSWSPSFFLSDTTAAQPLASPTKDIWYYMTVRDTMSCNVERTDSVFVKVDSCTTSVHSLQSIDNSEVRVYPNPADETIHVSSLTSNISHLTLTDISGKLLQRQTTNHEQQTPISTQHLAEGLYFVRVELSNGETMIRKIVVQ